MATVFNILVKVGGSAGTDCDYTTLNAVRAGTALDLTATTATKVYSGTKGGSVAFTDGDDVTLYRGGSPTDPATTGTVQHCAWGGSQILIKSITEGTAVASGDVWRHDADTYFTTSGAQAAGDSAAVKVSCSTTGAADTTTVNWASPAWTTGGDNYLEVCAAAGHEATSLWSTSKYRIETAGTSRALEFGVGCNAVRVTNLQISLTTVAGSCLGLTATGVLDIRVTGCLVKGNSTAGCYGIACSPAATSGTVKIWNNIVYGCTDADGRAIRIGGDTKYFYIYNNTLVHCGIGFSIGTVTTSRVFYFDNQVDCTDFKVGSHLDNDSNADYNASSTSETFGGTNDLASQTFTYTDHDGNDFSPASDSPVVGAGADPSSWASGALAFSTDMLGTTRTDWSIGAIEYVAASAPTGDGAVTLGELEIAGSAARNVTATAAITLGDLEIAGSAARNVTATAAIQLGQIDIIATGVKGLQITGAITLGSIDIDGVAERTITATGGIMLGSLDISAVAHPTYRANGAIELGAIDLTSAGTREITGDSAITLGSLTIAGGILAPPTGLYCNNGDDGAQDGLTNPTGITDLTPNFSALVTKLAANITDVQIQVSAEDDADFSEPLMWDSGWLTLDTPIAAVDTDGTARTEDITYGQG